MSHPAVFAYVEQPRATGSSMELTYMCGVIQLAVHDALLDYWSRPVEILTVAPSKWKKMVLGRGDYRKPKKDEDFEYQGLVWCRDHDAEVADDHESDGVCIAEYASAVVSFSS